MELDIEVFALPKLGAGTDEYEDAASPTGRCRLSGVTFSCAIADGATEASFSGLWARLLVEAYTSEPVGAVPIPLIELAARAAEKWNSSVGQKTLPWYAEQKAASGAFAALLGLHLAASPTADSELATYTADAIGDCCLIHMRGANLLMAFPLTTSEEFNSSPSLLATRPELNSISAVRRASGSCNSDDMLLLMSDAIARWFLTEIECGGHPWVHIRDLETSGGQAFEELVARLREAGQLKNDDTTIMRITVC